MRRQSPNPVAPAAAADHAHNRLRIHRLTDLEARIVTGGHAGKDMVVDAGLGLPQGIQRAYGLIRDIGYGRDPLLVVLAMPDGQGAAAGVERGDAVPVVRHIAVRELRSAIKSAKGSDDWTPPNGKITVIEPEKRTSDPISEEQVKGSQPELHELLGFNIGSRRVFIG